MGEQGGLYMHEKEVGIDLPRRYVTPFLPPFPLIHLERVRH
jgi:hypothetical protein